MASEDRLDRVERILARLAERDDKFAEQQDKLAERQDKLAERQDKLAERQDKLAERQEQFSLQQAELSAQIAETRKIAESNARSNQANSVEIAEMRSEFRELVRLITNYVEVTNRRLNALEERD